MKNYYRVMLGRRSAHAAECFKGDFIGTDVDIREDLSRKLPEDQIGGRGIRFLGRTIGGA